MRRGSEEAWPDSLNSHLLFIALAIRRWIRVFKDAILPYNGHHRHHIMAIERHH
jgi:hypothetical protein